MSRLCTRFSRGFLLVLCAVLLLMLFAASPAAAFAEPNDTLPGVAAPASPFVDAVQLTGDLRDIYRFTLAEGQSLWIEVGHEHPASSSGQLSLALFGPGTTDVDDLSGAITSSTLSPGYIALYDVVARAGDGGDYYLSNTASSGETTYAVSWGINTPSFELNPTSVSVTAIKGGQIETPYCQANWGPVGSHPTTFTVDCDQPWFSADPAEGGAQSYYSTRIEFPIDVASLTPGSYEGTATVRVLGAIPQAFHVSLHVLDQPTMSVWSSTQHVDYGALVTIAGSLRNGGGALMPGRSATLQRSYDGRSWSNVRTLLSTTGSYSTRVNVYRNTTFRWSFAGEADAAACSSPWRVVKSHVYLPRPIVPSHMHKGRWYTNGGILKPQHTNGVFALTIQWQRYSRGAWRSEPKMGVRALNYKTYSIYGYRERYGRGAPRRWRVRAIHYADSDHLSTYSSWRYYRVY